MVEAVGWCLCAMSGGLIISQVFGWGGGRVLPVVQSFTPYVLVLPFVIGVVALVTQRWTITGVCGLQAVGALVLVAPLIFVGRPPGGDAGQTITVAHANWLVSNPEPHDAAAQLIGMGADVLAVSEFTPSAEAALNEAAGGSYPHRFGKAMDGTEGIAVWSRWPLVDTQLTRLDARLAVIATVRTDRGDVCVLAVHPIPPFSRIGLAQWASSMRAISAAGRTPGPPTLIVGDFNASRWHPPFKRVLDDGWIDAHETLGAGFSTSWPTTGYGGFPSFVRLDHALLDRRLAPVAIRDVSLPGSDHLAFVVAVSIIAR
jgi:endonuclease/exonuclease/phosphatase (EEP) superfamily protein YafD